MLDVDQIHTYYGLSHILFDVSLTVRRRRDRGAPRKEWCGEEHDHEEHHGADSAADRGPLPFAGEPITGKKAYLLVRQGIAYVPDDRRVFADLTVDDNLEITFRRNKDWNKRAGL